VRPSAPVVLSLSALSLSALTLAGCGSETAATGSATPEPSARVAAYAALAEDFTGFFVKSVTVDAAGDLGSPQTVDDVLAKVDYTFRDGVTLAEYDPKHNRLCFTGPEDTYLTMTADDEGAMRRTLGTGDCDYEDGEVVLAQDTDSSTPPNDVALVSAAASDARNLATTLETMIVDQTDAGRDLSSMDLDRELAKWDFVLSDGNTIRRYDAAGLTYRFCILHEDSGAYATYDSHAGGLRGQGEDGSCSFDPNDSMDPTAEPDKSPADTSVLNEKVVKGADIVHQVPALTAFGADLDEALGQ
jgi:hypothetical protein